MGGSKDSYEGPSEQEIADRKKSLRSEWDYQAKQQEIEDTLEDKTDEVKATNEELKSRKGTDALLTNGRRGFMSPSTTRST